MAKQIGHGTTLSFQATTSTTSFTDLAYVRSIEGPNVSGDEVESTTLDTTGNYREFVPTLIDPGDLTAEIVWDPASTGTNTHVLLTTLLTGRTVTNWRMTLASSTGSKTCLFSGWVKSFSPSIPVDDLITASVTIRATSGVTWPTTA